MPKEWYNREINQIQDEDDDETIERKTLNMAIVADRKPYFMRYIYPDLMKKFKKYIENANKKALREFNCDLDVLLKKKRHNQAEKEFIEYFYMKIPIGIHPCVQNKICKKIEDEFDGYTKKNPPSVPFDYTILKTDLPYTKTQYSKIHDLYQEYLLKVQDFMAESYYQRMDQDDTIVGKAMLLRGFRQRCNEVCNDMEQLCNIVLDLCYTNNQSKQFAWDMCGTQIIENLLNKHNRRLSIPLPDDDGNIRFGGQRFSMMTFMIGDGEL